MRYESGVIWYAGAPNTGKTTLALKHAHEIVIATRRPVMVLDSISAKNFREEYHEENVEELVEGAWLDGVHTWYTPKSREEVEQICDACYHAGNIVLIIDETANWLTAKSGIDTGLLRLMRSHRHCLVNVLLTTQHLSGDIPQAAFACDPDIYLFLTTAPAALKVIERDFGQDGEHVRHLRQGEHLFLPSGISLDSRAASWSTPPTENASVPSMAEAEAHSEGNPSHDRASSGRLLAE